jgi:uncharacterized damage-inducible protein DinB
MSASLSLHLLTMARNNAWANHRLLRACAQLDAEEFAARRSGFFPSIRATLNHILTVDWMYVDALEREQRGEPPHPDKDRFYDPPEPYADAGTLWAAQCATDGRLLAYCAALDDTQLDREVVILRAGGAQRDTRQRLLAHLFQHQIHHRGQVHAMLADTRIAPPQLDEFFCTGDAPLRAADLAEMGWSEADLWH